MDKRTSWQIQKAVCKALFIREVKTRFGGYRLGYLWALIEPLSHILVLSALFSTIHDRADFYGTPFPVFFATGILAYFAFQKIVMTSLQSIKANEGLFGYRQVKPFDAIVVRTGLEVLVNIATLCFLVWLGAWVFGYNTFPADPLLACYALLLMFIFGTGVGFLTAVIGVMYEEWAKFVPHVMRPLYFLSGILFPLQAIPEKFHVYLLWNPLLHGVEQFRAAFLTGYPAVKTSLSYVALWAILSLLAGLWFYQSNRIRVLTR